MTSWMDHFIADLSSEDDNVRVRARQSLVELGARAVPSLIEALGQGKKTTRWEAAKALGEIKDAKAAPALVVALEDGDFDIRWLAAMGLIEMGVAGVDPLLDALKTRANSARLREGAHHVIREVARGSLRKRLDPVIKALDEMEPALGVPVAAFNAHETLRKSGFFGRPRAKKRKRKSA